ncbi:MAG: hypothetical protein R8G01_17430 [Ilumatobacteraceae bacterium]|nr:hypothetical protein [Ilumatobacteraceae bacterium]
MTDARLDATLHATDFGITVVSDIGCPWAHVAIHRLERERLRRGLDVELPVDHRAFPLELINGRPTPKEVLDREIPLCERLEPDAGWGQPLDPWSFPVSTLPALEAVQAAKEQGAAQSAALDLALRRAMFAEWRCIAVFPVVLEVAAEVEDLDVDRLSVEIRTGRPRAELWADLDQLATEVPGSPTFVLPDGSIVHNPGVEIGTDDDGWPTVERDEPEAIADLVTAALAVGRAD